MEKAKETGGEFNLECLPCLACQAALDTASFFR